MDTLSVTDIMNEDISKESGLSVEPLELQPKQITRTRGKAKADALVPTTEECVT